MKHISKFIMAAALLCGVSCTSYLDMTPTDRVSDKVLWKTTETAEYGVNYIYSYVLDIYGWQSTYGFMTEALTDQLKYGSYNYVYTGLIPSEFAYGDDVTMTAGYVDAYMGVWSSLYTAIRKTNQAIRYLGEYGQMSDEDKARLNAELRFMRGYMYFELAKRYKEVIIYDENLEAIVKDKKLSAEEECWDFVYADLKTAADVLPAKAQANGRINCGMAWALISRAMLYAGRYDKVIEAADKVEELGYSLEAQYADAYSKSISDGNKEAILQYVFSRADNVTHSFDYYYTPGGDYYALGEAGGGYATPTQEMVESYELATGGFPDWTQWHGTTTATPPYAQLEPRFQASILYNGAAWKDRTIEPFIGGTDGFCQWNLEQEPKGRTTTGYYLRKGVDESHNVITEPGSVQPLTIIRFAEVLLNKAEACYRTGKEADANAVVKQIRQRVGLNYSNKSGAELWAAIRQERKVEFAYEGLQYWDLRRWGVASKAYPEGLCGYKQHGLKITKDASTGEFTYEYVSVDDKNRNYPQRLDRFPLPESELSSNGAISQFPEWK